MSAYVVDHDHVNAILTTCKMAGGCINCPMDVWIEKPGNDELTRIGQMLLAENYRAVNYRYRQPADGDAKEIDAYRFEVYTPFVAAHANGGAAFDKVLLQAVKLIQSYRYQCNETDDWHDSTAAKWTGEMAVNLASKHSTAKDIWTL